MVKPDAGVTYNKVVFNANHPFIFAIMNMNDIVLTGRFVG